MRDIGPMMTKPDKVMQLRAAGFAELGRWQLDVNSFPHIVGDFPREPGVYSFIVDNEVLYVGSAQNGLKGRMRRYNRPNNDGSNVTYMRPLIRATLLDGAEVKVFARTMKSSIVSDGVQLDSIAGLEEGLIRAWQPDWNRRGPAKLRKSKLGRHV